jgi:hypothetical protein
LQAGTAVYYSVERVYLGDGEAEERRRSPRHLISANSAQDAARAFIESEGASMIGSVSALRGDKATATAVHDGKAYVVFVERGADSIQSQ